MFKFFRYLSRFVEDGRTGTPSIKRFGLALAVTILSAVMLSIGIVVCYVTISAPSGAIIDLVRILCGTLEMLAGLVLTAVTTGYLVDKAQARNKETDDNGETYVEKVNETTITRSSSTS